MNIFHQHHRTYFSSHYDGSNVGPITSVVKDQIQAGKLREDEDQLRLSSRLDDLIKSLSATDANIMACSKLSVDLFSDAPKKGIYKQTQAYLKRSYFKLTRSKSTTPRGIYVHGSVGVGKSFLMDLFFDAVGRSTTWARERKVRRAHFHEFMLDIHDRIHQYKRIHPKSDPLPAVALSLAQEARLLCLDEFQVTDIADAMILKRLFSMLWMNHMGGSVGMVVVATSNRAPEVLYEGGLNRSLFLPFIHTLKDNMDIIEMHGDKDYRREQHSNSKDGWNGREQDRQLYFWPAEHVNTRQALERIFSRGGGQTQFGTTIAVRMGRTVKLPRANDTCAWIDFHDLCNQPLGAADYLAICNRYPVLIVDNVPQLNASRFNEARRFVTLVDALYESKTRLVLASQVPLNELLVDFDATVETNDGDEEIAVEGIENNHRTSHQNWEEEMFVIGEGGSSSSAATTMIRTKDGEVEWSATGRIGVSLAQLSAVRDVSFSFQRAESRLVEMNNGSWGR
jgi:protein AFG1